MERNNHLLLGAAADGSGCVYSELPLFKGTAPPYQVLFGLLCRRTALRGSHVRLGNTALTDHKKDISKA